jgi:VWFA-related protein
MLEGAMQYLRSSLLLSTVVVWACGLFGQSTVAPPPTFQASTTDVIVDVVVTDHHGLPVEGLSQDRFSVSENGHLQQIVTFEAHPSSAAAPPPIPTLPPGVYTNAPVVSGDGVANVLLIDALNTPTQNQVRTHQMLIAYLKTLPVNKPVAIFTLGTQLRQIEDFTTDHTALLQAVETFNASPRKSPLLKTQEDTAAQMKDEDDALAMAQGLRKPIMGTQRVLNMKQFNAESDSFNIALRVGYTLSAFDQLARYLSAIPGRKNLIWLSGSFPLAIEPQPDLKNPYQSARDFSQQVERTANLLTTARVAVYPIDAEGLVSQTFLQAPVSGGSAARNPDRSIAAESAEFSNNAEEVMTLDKVAQATGGEAIDNSNDLKGALAEADRNGSHYYTLVYHRSDNAQDNKPRHIEVHVAPGKYQLSYRRSYTPVRPSGQKVSFLSLMQHEVPASTQIVFRLSPRSIGAPPAEAAIAGSNQNVYRPVVRYSIGYDVDVAPLALTASGDGVLHGAATFVAIALDRDGKAVNSASGALELHVRSEQYSRFLKEGIQFHQQLDLPAQTRWLRAAVYDHDSGRIGTLEVPINPALGQAAH